MRHECIYARTTSIMGVSHIGHFPVPQSNSWAHLKQVHICPHLKRMDNDTQEINITCFLCILNCLSENSCCNQCQVPVKERINLRPIANTTICSVCTLIWIIPNHWTCITKMLHSTPFLYITKQGGKIEKKKITGIWSSISEARSWNLLNSYSKVCKDWEEEENHGMMQQISTR